MKRTLTTFLLLTIAAFLVSFTLYKAISPYGRCTGSKNCTACKNCSACKHCAQNGGKCGICR